MNQNAINYNLSSQLISFKKSISSNNRQGIQKYLSQIKNLSEEFLNQALFWCIQNYKVQQQTDQCLHILLKYTSQTINKTKCNPNCEINLQTPLIAACKKGQLSLIKRLIENGAKVDMLNSQGKHPLEFILQSRQQNYDIAEYLISQIQSVNIPINNKHPIMISVDKQYARIFKSLIDKGSQIVFQDSNILHYIFKKKFKNIMKKKKILKELTSKYLLFTQQDKNGKIPIEYQQNQQIKAYYNQNFKIKKIPEPSFNSNQKTISNNSSLFINEKISKKELKPSYNQKKKALHESFTLIGKNTKQAGKQTKNLLKQFKEEDVSFEDQIEDKSEGQIEDEEKQDKTLQKVVNKINTLSHNTNKKCLNKQTNLSNFSTQFNTSIKDQNSLITNNSLLNSNTGTKLKSKYSNIGPKTQTNLKKTNKNNTDTNKTNLQGNRSNVQSNKGQTKRSFGSGNTLNKQGNKRKNQQQKKQVTSNRKTVVNEQKQYLNTHQLQNTAGKRWKETQQQNKSVGGQQDLQQTILRISNNIIIQTLTVQKEGQKQQQIKLPKRQINQDNQEQKIYKKQDLCQLTKQNTSNYDKNIVAFGQKGEMKQKKQEYEVILQKCDKIMSQIIIKEQQQTTNLKQIKQKFNEVFYQYQLQKSKINNDLQKLKQLKLSNNQIIHNCTLSNIKSNFSKPINKQSLQSPNRLTQQILSIQKKCHQNSQSQNKLIQQAIQLISKKIHSALTINRKETIQVSIEIYGSRANGLEIQTSDIDLLIICNINQGVQDLMSQIQRSKILNCPEINQAKFLTNTSMPIVKLSLNQKFLHMNIDLTFQIRGHTGIRCTTLIKQFISAQNLLKPLVLTLKTLLNSYDLCDTYTGGIGSYSLTLMSIALLQFTQIKKTKQNLGEILLQFLLFYGFQLDYICQAIIIHPPGFNQKPAFSIYQLPYSLDLSPKLIIYDPLNPVNNVGRATYRIVQLKKLFKIWYVMLKTQFSQMKNGIEELIRVKDEVLSKTRVTQF